MYENARYRCSLFDRSYILDIGYTEFVVYIDCCVSKMTVDKLRETRREMGEGDIVQQNMNNVTHFKVFFPERENNIILPVACLTGCADRNTFMGHRGVSQC